MPFSADNIAERIPLQDFHDDIIDVSFFAHVKYRNDIRVGQTGSGLRLPPETVDKLRVFDEFRFQKFYGNETVEQTVFGFIHHRHAAVSDFFD